MFMFARGGGGIFVVYCGFFFYPEILFGQDPIVKVQFASISQFKELKIAQ